MPLARQVARERYEESPGPGFHGVASGALP